MGAPMIVTCFLPLVPNLLLLKFYLYFAKDSISCLGSYSCPPGLEVLTYPHIIVVLLVTLTSAFSSSQCFVSAPKLLTPKPGSLGASSGGVEETGIQKKWSLLGSWLWILPLTLSWWTVILLIVYGKFCASTDKLALFRSRLWVTWFWSLGSNITILYALINSDKRKVILLYKYANCVLSGGGPIDFPSPPPVLPPFVYSSQYSSSISVSVLWFLLVPSLWITRVHFIPVWDLRFYLFENYLSTMGGGLEYVW